MIKDFKFRKILPRRVSAPLWGDREKWGKRINEDDSCWKEWQEKCVDFYNANQRNGIGEKVNRAGYKVMKSIDLLGKTVVEVGPGDIRHIDFWNSNPSKYVLVDIPPALPSAFQRLKKSIKNKLSSLYKSVNVLGFFIILQVLLGIFTLLYGAQILIASMHQISSIFLVASSIYFLFINTKTNSQLSS